MKHQITKEDLVRDIYGETDYLEKMAIQKAKHSDSKIKENHNALKKAQQLLDAVDIQPPSFVVQNILNYSKSSEFEAEAG
ncbi:MULTISPECIES: hypothetical protein [unclassified Aureispira]|uniref:hypothetical protein n=1 Tax=unclassified Aureispira TaxID=2649989 RepID=UPI00069887D6|nr:MULTISPECIES: hypothetical protein [unclassified Aureispira]WMX15381.1 hypothetical protein QP953_03210 [Aureispira sp. CCB-E]